MSVSHGIVAKLSSAAEFFRRRWFSQTVWRPYLQTGYAIFKITDFSYCLRFFAWVKKISPYFPFHNVGRSGLHRVQLAWKKELNSEMTKVQPN